MQSLGLSLKSGRATAAKAVQARKQAEQEEVTSISMKPEGISISRYMPTAKPAEPNILSGEHTFSAAEDTCSAPIEETLDVITSIETALRENRKTIEAIKARREEMAQEYRQLGISLGSALFYLSKQIEDAMKDLRTNVLVSKSFTNGTKETI